MNPTAENSRNCFKSFYSLYTGLWSEKKNDETCRTHAKKIPLLHLFANSGWLCNVFIWKNILAKRMLRALYCLYKRANDYQ